MTTAAQLGHVSSQHSTTRFDNTPHLNFYALERKVFREVVLAFAKVDDDPITADAKNNSAKQNPY